jgi:peptidoglycan/xylan/chitin deacetylase (PgdA/CDA1 family)
MAAHTIGRMPGRFGVARLLGASYSLRCVVFHHTAAAESPFTGGINVTTTPDLLEAKLKFLVRNYTPVRFQDVLDHGENRSLPPRAVLVTFDDAYASVIHTAAPLCARYGVPAVFFVNAAFLDNRQLAPDNLVCYVANTSGMGAVNAAAQAVRGQGTFVIRSLSDVFTRFFPAISLSERKAFLDALARLAGVDGRALAEEVQLYATSEQIGQLANPDFEIGNHTHTHVHCRCLSPAEIQEEVDQNQAVLEKLSGRKVRSLSVPYGSSADLTTDLVQHLRGAGYRAAFLSESLANSAGADLFHLDRVSSLTTQDDTFFLELEVLPRIRVLRNRFFPSREKDSRVISRQDEQRAFCA